MLVMKPSLKLCGNFPAIISAGNLKMIIGTYWKAVRMTPALLLSFSPLFLIPRFMSPAHDKEQQQKPSTAFCSFLPFLSFYLTLSVSLSLSLSIEKERSERQQLLWQLLVSAIDKMIRRL